MAEPIKLIFNCSYAKSIFPDQWKVAKLHPIPKDKNFLLEDINSRPISLMNVLITVLITDLILISLSNLIVVSFNCSFAKCVVIFLIRVLS